MMKESCLLSFIIPCYNAERFLTQCLDSVLKCGLKESQYEIICIDDCSSDSTATLLEQYAESHHTVRVFRNESNVGPGGGRNKGIMEARGEYLWFVDADDLILSDGFLEALNHAMEEHLDVLCFNFCRINEEGCVLSRPKVFNYIEAKGGYEFVKVVFDTSIVAHMGYLVRFIFRSAFLRKENIFCPEHIVYGEDTVFMPKALLKANRVGSVPDIFYAYRINPDSTTESFSHKYSARLIFDLDFLTGAELLSFSEEIQDESLKKAIKRTAVSRYINYYVIHLLRTDKEQRTLLYREINNNIVVVTSLMQNMNLLSRLLLIPHIGPFCAEILSFVYKTKHKIQNSMN